MNICTCPALGSEPPPINESMSRLNLGNPWRLSWGQPDGIDQTRTFMGVSKKISDKVTFKPGVLHQYVFRDAGDSDNIALSLNLVASF
jgi:hypothetical protein